MRRSAAAVALVILLAGGCTNSGSNPGPPASSASSGLPATSAASAPLADSFPASSVPTFPAASAPTTQPQEATPAEQAADAALVLSMYDTITRAFQRDPKEGVRTLIAAQYPGDIKDVDFARCVKAILPGASTLPPGKKLHFVPNIGTMTSDSGYTLTSDRVRGLHPQGRIYVTDVVITDGTKPRIHSRHQVILDGKAYQFSVC